MGRIQALSSLLLSTLIKSNEDALNVGISWAEKLGDASLRLWGCYQKCGKSYHDVCLTAKYFQNI